MQHAICVTTEKKTTISSNNNSSGPRGVFKTLSFLVTTDSQVPGSFSLVEPLDALEDEATESQLADGEGNSALAAPRPSIPGCASTPVTTVGESMAFVRNCGKMRGD